MSAQNNSLRYVWIAIFIAVLLWSGINPHDYPTWWLEVLPAIIGGAVLWYTRDTFPLTPLTYILILIPCVPRNESAASSDSSATHHSMSS